MVRVEIAVWDDADKDDYSRKYVGLSPENSENAAMLRALEVAGWSMSWPIKLMLERGIIPP
jgi:hypothetical protein